MTVRFSLYRGSAHVLVDANQAFVDHVGDAIGRPVREQFPELGGTGIFDAMDTVYLTGRECEFVWHCPYDEAPGRMLIIPWHVAGSVAGLSCHFHVDEPRPRRVAPDLAHVAQVSAVAALVPLFW